jgi:primosomal protein N' (replication factor Y)
VTTFAEIAVNLPPVRGAFHYHLPQELEGLLRPGHLVTAPFGPRRVQGIVLRILPSAAVPETRPIEALLDPDPVLTPAQMALAHWLADHTQSPLIDCLTLMLPPGLSQQADTRYTLAGSGAVLANSAAARLVRLLEQRGPLLARQIDHALPRLEWRRAADRLVQKGILARSSVLEPPRLRPRRIRTATLAAPSEAISAAIHQPERSLSAAAQRRAKVIDVLRKETRPLDVSWIYAETGASAVDLRRLEELGLITLGEEEIWRDPLAEAEFLPRTPPDLTADQAAAWAPIEEALHRRPSASHTAFLLHGVTGSGKTEIYLRATAEVVQGGGGALILVPEIALTAQTVERFLARFAGRVGILHSRLTEGERYDTWRRARAGQLDILIGPRSALFAPHPRIRLIVLDEAHDEAYKEQSLVPRYDARPAALAYARALGAVCILGSATPDLLHSYQARHGELGLLRLPQRILGHRQRLARQSERLRVRRRYRPAGGEAEFIDLPPVHLVDMRQELRAGNRSLFSRTLQQTLNETLAAGEQAILFLNRRGAATYVFCRDCGRALRCARCDTPLTYHSAREELLCHHCGYRRRAPRACPACGSERIRQFGAGTQRIEAELHALAPAARTLRWDRDTTRSRGAHDLILGHFIAHRADVLIGTQMIAKGLDLPLVTLVGVISADTGLHLPDFRAAERTFQILTQVAGRAGRGLLGGRVILQTFNPDHYAIRAAAAHDYEAFYQAEIRHRRDLGYPPFQRLARLVFRHTSEEKARREADRMSAALTARIAASGDPAELIGPAPCFFRRLRGDYRWQVVLRASDPAPFLPQPLPDGWALDIDPVSLL